MMRVHVLCIIWVRRRTNGFSGPSTKKTQVLAVTSAEFQRYETRTNGTAIGVRERGQTQWTAPRRCHRAIDATVTRGSYRKLHGLI